MAMKKTANAFRGNGALLRLLRSCVYLRLENWDVVRAGQFCAEFINAITDGAAPSATQNILKIISLIP